MIFAQTPSLQIFISAQAMPISDMPMQRFSCKAAIEANHVVVAYGLPHGHSRGTNLFGLNWLAKLSKRSMHRCNEF